MNSQAYRGNSGPLRVRNICQAVPMVRASGRRGRGVRGGIAEAFPAALNFLFLGFPEKKSVVSATGLFQRKKFSDGVTRI